MCTSPEASEAEAVEVWAASVEATTVEAAKVATTVDVATTACVPAVSSRPTGSGRLVHRLPDPLIADTSLAGTGCNIDCAW